MDVRYHSVLCNYMVRGEGQVHPASQSVGATQMAQQQLWEPCRKLSVRITRFGPAVQGFIGFADDEFLTTIQPVPVRVILSRILAYAGRHLMTRDDNDRIVP